MVRVVVGVVVGVVVYGACLLAFRVEEIDALRERLRDRRPGNRSIDAVGR